jgi:two-component sensor histidine kinase
MDDFRRRFSHRLQGLAASHDLLVRQNWRQGDLAELVASQLAPFDEMGSVRLDADGPSVSLDAGAVQNIGLLFHELGTNASKYGALSVPEGKVVIRWTLDSTETEARSLRLSWTERGGPPVETPAYKGFGLIVIERTVAAALNGRVSIDFAPQGVSCSLDIPTSHVICRSP